jgi:hypothetical protein
VENQNGPFGGGGPAVHLRAALEEIDAFAEELAEAVEADE